MLKGQPKESVPLTGEAIYFYAKTSHEIYAMGVAAFV